MREIVDIADEAERHKDEWLLFEITEVNEIDVPVKGRLLFHGESRDELHHVSMEHPEVVTYAFFTGPLVPPNMEVVL